MATSKKSCTFRLWEGGKYTIKKEFSKVGKKVITCDDFGPFKAWQDRGRRVKYGSKGLTVIGKNIYAQLMFKNGKPMKDEK